jgi:two-component system, OmpR family, phosphate regulon response regulator PhoB
MTTSRTILFIFPETRLRVAARVALEDAGHEVCEMTRVALLSAADLPSPPDVVVGPWEYFPTIKAYAELNGRRVRLGGIALIVLARSEEIKRAIACLDRGADDCLTVPFEPEELVVRVHACLRRRELNGSAQRELIAGPMVLDKAAHALVIADQSVPLAPAELRLMTFFFENEGRAFTRHELLSRVWAAGSGVAERTVDVHVRRLRRALEPYGCEGAIQTVRKFGYRFSPNVVSAKGRASARSAFAGVGR